VLLPDPIADPYPLLRLTSLPPGSGNHYQEFAVLAVDVELGLVDGDVDQGVPVGEADGKPLPGDLGDAVWVTPRVTLFSASSSRP